MTDYRLAIAPEVAEIIRHLPPELKRSVTRAGRSLEIRPYRVVYAIEPRRRVLRILAVGPRVEIYERVAATLRRAPPKRK